MWEEIWGVVVDVVIEIGVLFDILFDFDWVNFLTCTAELMPEVAVLELDEIGFEGVAFNIDDCGKLLLKTVDAVEEVFK